MNLLRKLTPLLVILLNSAFIGAMVLIGLVLVPFWQSSEPQVFLDWFSNYSRLIGRIMIPLGPGVLLLSVITALIIKKNKKMWWLTSALILVNVLYFPIYYLPTNTAFTEQFIAIEAVPETLSSWALFHWQRVIFATLALVTAIVALVKSET